MSTMNALDNWDVIETARIRPDAGWPVLEPRTFAYSNESMASKEGPRSVNARGTTQVDSKASKRAKAGKAKGSVGLFIAREV